MKNPFSYPATEIEAKAKEVRRSVLTMNANAGQGHTGADLSQADILCTLFFNHLKYELHDFKNLNRDRFILSKGHGAGGFYCMLAAGGFINASELNTYLAFNSRLPGHPVRQKLPGLVEINTGGLGHGLPVAVGLALSKKIGHYKGSVYVLTGDGELQEGSNWEALMCAAHFNLDNLIIIVDRNGLQLADRTKNIMSLEPLSDKFTAFGAEVFQTDGHAPKELLSVLAAVDDDTSGKPKTVIARTFKGRGVSFIEDNAAWHHKTPNAEELIKAYSELE
jgi:transketolase